MMLKSAWRAGGRISANFQYNIQLQILSIGNLNKNAQKNILKFVQLFLEKIAQKNILKFVQLFLEKIAQKKCSKIVQLFLKKLLTFFSVGCIMYLQGKKNKQTKERGNKNDSSRD